MKAPIAGLVLLAATLSAAAVDEALLDQTDVWQLYCTPQYTLTRVDGDTADMLGVGIGGLLNNQIMLGGALRMLCGDNLSTDDINVDRWDFWYAGGEVGYILAPTQLVHASASLLFGGGRLTLQEFSGEEAGDFMVVEPGLQLGVNVYQDIEIGVGVGYRWVSGVDLDQVSDSDLSDWTGTVFLRATQF